MIDVKTVSSLMLVAGLAVPCMAQKGQMEYQPADYAMDGDVSQQFAFENGNRGAVLNNEATVAEGPLRGTAPGEPDLAWCELYDLDMFGRTGDVAGMAIATTSFNVGDADLMWFPNPNNNHPFIVANLYRVMDGRMMQIGQSWCKHGFFALGNSQCNGFCSYEPGHSQGNWLGQRCTDTYWAGLNADQGGLGPRYEINAWDGEYSYNGSVLQTGGGTPTNGGRYRRLQVRDADLDPAMNAGAQYYIEGYYLVKDDHANIINNFAHKTVDGISGSPGGNWNFNVSGFSTNPLYGPAIFRWPGTNTLIAEEIPVDKDTSPDGRAYLKTNNWDNGDGSWRYEYVIFNIDMDRMVDSFTIPLPPGVDVTNIGFHAPEHWDEPTAWPNGPAIDNADWSVSVDGSSITWSTSTNPIRWGTMYNFWFDATATPGVETASLGMFKTGGPSELTGSTLTPLNPLNPTGCPGDADGDGDADFDDLNLVLNNWGTAGPDGDVFPFPGGDGAVDFDDLNEVLTSWGIACQ